MTFRQCTDDVKIQVNSYSTNFYGCTLWTKFIAIHKWKAVTACKQVFRNLLSCKKQGSTFQMINFSTDPMILMMVLLRS